MGEIYTIIHDIQIVIFVVILLDLEYIKKTECIILERRVAIGLDNGYRLFSLFSNI